MKRIWKPVEGYNRWYDVSNTGHVRTWKIHGRYYVRRIIPKILKTPLYPNYPTVRLTKNGKPNTLLVHRLVAEAFIPNPENKPQVNHINEIKTDNNVTNLEWVTARENVIHSMSSDKSDRMGNAKLTPPDVRKIRKLYNNTDLTQKEIAKKFPVKVQSIRKVLDGRSWSHVQ